MAIKEKNNLTIFQSVTYSSGQLSSMLINQILVTWAMYFYEPLASMVLLGAAMSFGRIVDAITDALIGYASDRTRTRWGRRIPYVVFGTPFMMLFFLLIWKPPIQHFSNTNVWYFAAMAGGFFLFYTIVVAPYLAIMPDIARSDSERMRVATMQAVFSIVGLIIAFVVAPIIIGKHSRFMTMAIVMAAISAFFFYFSIAFVRETPQQAEIESFSYFQAVVATFKNKAFVFWVLCIFMFWIGFNVVMVDIPFYVTRVLGQSEDKAALYQGVLMLVTIPMFVIVLMLSNKVSKKLLIAAAMILLTVFTPFFYATTYVPKDARQTFALVLFALLAIPISVLLIMANAIIADIVDIDEALTGQRREAMYFGMQGVVTKSAIALSAFVGGVLLETFGKTAAHPGGILLAGPFSAIFTLVGFIAILFYPSEKTIADILAGAKNKQKPV